MLVRAKGRRRAQMPMPPDGGAAVVSYLGDGRPTSSCRRLFLRMLAPKVGFASGCAITMIAKTALERAGAVATHTKEPISSDTALPPSLQGHVPAAIHVCTGAAPQAPVGPGHRRRWTTTKKLRIVEESFAKCGPATRSLGDAVLAHCATPRSARSAGCSRPPPPVQALQPADPAVPAVAAHGPKEP